MSIKKIQDIHKKKLTRKNNHSLKLAFKHMLKVINAGILDIFNRNNPGNNESKPHSGIPTGGRHPSGARSPLIYPVDIAATKLRMTKEQLSDLVRQGRLRQYRHNGKNVFLRNDIDSMSSSSQNIQSKPNNVDPDHIIWKGLDAPKK